MIPEIEGVNYFLSTYREFMSTKNRWCGITLNREQADQFIKECEMIEKHLKALDIIIKKEVEIYELKRHVNSLNDYNFWCDSMSLSSEEFDLLKEVLGNE